MTANCEINSPIDSDTNARQPHDPHTNHQLTTSFFARAPDNAGSACVGSRVGGRVGRHYAWLRIGMPASDFCARVRSGRGGLTCEPGNHAELPGTVDLAHLGADLSLRSDRSDGAIWTACWS